MDLPLQFLIGIKNFLAASWWFWIFFILLPLARSFWLHWRQEEYEHSDSFRAVLLEMRIFRENERSPAGMEQVLHGIHILRNVQSNFREHYIDGEITREYTFEIVSFGGEVHFYIRCWYKQATLIQTAFYAFYPEVELVEVEDYVHRFPKTVQEIHEQGYELWGTEIIKYKRGIEEALPIKTYREFESPDPNKEYDPISHFFEVLGNARPQEIAAIQIIAAPKGPEWKEEFTALVTKLKGPTTEDKEKAKTVVDFSEGKILPALGVKTATETGGTAWWLYARTPGETDVLKALENNLAKPAFETMIRYLYFSPKELYSDSYGRRALSGIFNQYNRLDTNGFRRNFAVETRVSGWYFPFVFPRLRSSYRRQRLLHNYVRRKLRYHTFAGKILNAHIMNLNFATKTTLLTTEELATLFHPPIKVVLTAPHVRHIESRKVAPPAGLPIFGDERDIEHFQ